MSLVFDRRTLLLGAALFPLGAARAAPAPLRVTLLGQSLIQQDIPPWPGEEAIVARLSHVDAVFSDVETAILGPGTPTRAGEVLHAAPPVVLDRLRQLGITLVTTANNHAWDLGTAGITSALAEIDARGIVHAGSGTDLSAATRAGIQRTAHGAVALVSAAAGAIRNGAAATPQRPGVNELRRDPSGGLNHDDVARTLDAIRQARARNATVIACLHNHYWESDPANTPQWQREYARRCVDAGASIFVSHGPPLLQGIERYKGVPLLHGLGSFIFQTRKASYGPGAWQSVMVEARFRDGIFLDGRLMPLVLESKKATPDAEFTSGTPAFATGARAAQIGGSLATLSQAMGTSIDFRDGIGNL